MGSAVTIVLLMLSLPLLPPVQEGIPGLPPAAYGAPTCGVLLLAASARPVRLPGLLLPAGFPPAIAGVPATCGVLLLAAPARPVRLAELLLPAGLLPAEGLLPPGGLLLAEELQHQLWNA